MPTGTIRLAGRRSPCPVTVTIRSIEVGYTRGRVTGTARTIGPEGPVTVAIDTAVADGTVDDNAVQGLIPALTWGGGSSWSLPVFSAAQNESRATTLTVMGTESVALATGPTEAFRVHWTGAWQEATFWVSVAVPHRVLRIAVAGTPLDIVRVP